MMRIGHGYDVHKFAPDRRLVLGGVDIPHDMGLLGHSDADALTHAVIDALLGAAGLGDIGTHYPDNLSEYAGIDSLLLLSRVYCMITDKGFTIQNIDCTVVCQRPKLAPHIPLMVEKIASALNAAATQINVKATTEEGLGFTGAGEGIAAHAVCLLRGAHHG